MTSDGLKSLASSCGKVLAAEIATKEVPQAGGKSEQTSSLPSYEHDLTVVDIQSSQHALVL